MHSEGTSLQQFVFEHSWCRLVPACIIFYKKKYKFGRLEGAKLGAMWINDVKVGVIY